MRVDTNERDKDRGAVIVLAALLLVPMLGMAALVIDIANTTQVRRQAQATVDAAALAGAQDLPNAPAVVATVKAYAERNLAVAIGDWVGCSDPDALAISPDSASSNSCISINASYEQVRVKLPTRSVPTYFGGVLGVSAFTVNAGATAEAQLRSDGRIIPAAVTASMGTGNLCIENAGNNQDCASRSSGNFGSLDSPRLNIYKPSSNEDPNSLRTNYAMSLDHDVQIFGSGLRICDGDLRSPCSISNGNTTYTANHLNVYTGNAIPPVTEGFVKGFTIRTDDMGQVSFCGRLQRPDITPANIAEPSPSGCQPGSPTINALGTTINGRHIYYWMKPWAKQAFYPEVYNADPTGTNPRPVGHTSYAAGDTRLDCFLAGYRYDQATGTETVPQCTGVTIPANRLAPLGHLWPMFTKDLPSDPRFGVIPVLSSWVSGNSNAAPLVGFWGIFTYRLYLGPQKVDGVDAWVYDPALVETEAGTPGLQFGSQPDPVVRLVQ